MVIIPQERKKVTKSNDIYERLYVSLFRENFVAYYRGITVGPRFRKEDLTMQLGKFNSFLYGILLTATIILMIVYIIWLIKEVIVDSDIDWKDKASTFKEQVQRKWYGLKSKIKYSN